MSDRFNLLDSSSHLPGLLLFATHYSLRNSSSLALMDFCEHNNHIKLTANGTAGISEEESTF
jgi:hypothetical protein